MFIQTRSAKECLCKGSFSVLFGPFFYAARNCNIWADFRRRKKVDFRPVWAEIFRRKYVFWIFTTKRDGFDWIKRGLQTVGKKTWQGLVSLDDMFTSSEYQTRFFKVICQEFNQKVSSTLKNIQVFPSYVIFLVFQ